MSQREEIRNDKGDVIGIVTLCRDGRWMGLPYYKGRLQLSVRIVDADKEKIVAAIKARPL